jgi:hypothetical protein
MPVISSIWGYLTRFQFSPPKLQSSLSAQKLIKNWQVNKMNKSVFFNAKPQRSKDAKGSGVSLRPLPLGDFALKKTRMKPFVQFNNLTIRNDMLKRYSQRDETP